MFDKFFKAAARLIVERQSSHPSIIQLHFMIGYNRTQRILEQLEAAEIIGISRGSKPREILIKDLPTLEKRLNELKLGEQIENEPYWEK
jgi:S-DNA-T family DNA segregation ATPase FtsK/SpoIIIE